MHAESSNLIRGGIVVAVAVLVSVAGAGVALGAGGTADTARSSVLADGERGAPPGEPKPASGGPDQHRATGATAPDAARAVANATAANGTVAGTVVGPDGTPAAGAHVVAVDASVNAHRLLADAGWWTTAGIIYPSTVAEVTASPRAPGVYVVSTGAGGDYALSLPPGTYTLRAYRSWSGNMSAFVSEDQPTVTVSAGDRRQVGFTGRPPISILIRPPLYRTDIGNVSGERGETVRVPVEVATFDYSVGTEYERLSHDVTGARATLTFNPDVAQAVSVEGADMTVTDSTIDNDAGTVSFDVTSSDSLERATMATVEFRLVADRSTTTHLIPDAPTTLRTTNGSVSPTDDDPPWVDTNKGELVVTGDGGNESGPSVSRVAFDYVDFGGNVNLEVNGDRRNVADFAALDGATVGDTAVRVTPPTDTDPGTVRIAGLVVTRGGDGTPITSFSVGGQELMIDDVRFGPPTDPRADVEFTTLTPASSDYAVGDTFTSSPSGVRMTVEPFRFSDGRVYRDGSGSRVGSLPDPFSPVAGAGFGPWNVNLRFNLTSVAADAEPPVVGASDGAATDPDGDGVYEDVNGDGEVTPADATVLFSAVFEGDPAVTDNVALFDLNGDGEVTPGDAGVLFAEAFGA